MSKEERYAEHTVAWELPNGDSVTKSNYNLADIETKYMPIQTEVICDDKDKTIADLEAKLAEAQKTIEIQNKVNNALIDENLDYRYDITDTAYEQAKHMAESWEEDYQQEIEELKQQLAEKDLTIENWQTMYESVVQTCHNDKEEIERLNKRLETQEHTITNLVEDNRASQEWYKKQLEEKEKEIENLKEQFDVFTIKNSFKYQNVIEKSKMQFAVDYAIEQLEELRLSFICNYHDNISWIDDRENSCCLNLTTTIYNTTMDIFDNQIKQLKEME